jgi:hypothetical protein
MRQEVAMFVDGAALGRHVIPEGRERLVEAGSAIDDEEVWPAQAWPTSSSRTAR